MKKKRKFMLGIVAFYTELDLKLDKFVFFFFFFFNEFNDPSSNFRNWVFSIIYFCSFVI
jgi:hypothetical protein